MRVVKTFEYLEQAWDEAAQLFQENPRKRFIVSHGDSGFDVLEEIEQEGECQKVQIRT